MQRQSFSLSDCQPKLTIDAEAPLPQLTLKTVKQLEQLSPFGQDHPRPTLCARGVRLGNEPKRMGRGERHLSVMLEQNRVRLRGIAFHQGQWADELTRHGDTMDIAYRPVLNEVQWPPFGGGAPGRLATRGEIGAARRHTVSWRASQRKRMSRHPRLWRREPSPVIM